MTVTIAEHLATLHAAMRQIPAIDVLLADAAGAILAEDLSAEAQLPVWDVAACDGYAVNSADVAEATDANPVGLAVSNDVSGGARGPRRHVPTTAARVTSGAPVPIGADTVVPAKETDGGVARVVISRAPNPGEHVRPAGNEAYPGQVLVQEGTRLGARQIAMAAMLGRHRLRVHPIPRVVIMAVGSGLRDPGSSSRGLGVIEANSHGIKVRVEEAGAHAYRVGIVSGDRVELKSTIEDQLVRADMIITTGGLSGSANDTLAAVLSSLGDFTVSDVAVTPGSRHGFGVIDASDRGQPTPVIALPGHPAAASIAFLLYVRPALRAMSGYEHAEQEAVTAVSSEGWDSPAGVLQCVPVKFDDATAARIIASPVGSPGAVSLSDIALADALAIIPEKTTKVGKGDTLSCIPLSE